MKRALPAIKGFFKKADILLLCLCLICCTFGIILISSATQSYENPMRYVLIQAASVVIGLGLYVVLTIIDIDIIADKWPVLVVFSFVLLIALAFIGEAGESGNRSWIRFLGIGIQPTEIVKVMFIIVMAKHITYLMEYKNLNSPLSVVQLLVHFGVMFGLIIGVSDDLGSALVFFFLFVAMLFIAGLKLYWFAIGIAAAAALTPFLWTHFLRSDQKERILAPYLESIDTAGFGVKWQTNHSKLALASGQLTGTGLYNGTQSQSDGLVHKQTDFIFAVAGEELGMIACLAIIALLLAVIVRCVYIGMKSKDTLSMLVCVGVAATVFFQAFENIGMCISLTPVIGLTLPLFSYGGSSIWTTLALMGIVSGIKYRPKPERFRRHL